MKKVKFLYIYYISIFCLSIVAILIVPKPIKNFIPMLVLFNAPILFFTSFNINFNLSQKIKTKHPEIYEKYKFDNGISIISGDIISIISYFNNSDFDNFEMELKEKCILIKKMFLLSVLSFILGSFLAIWTVYTK